MENEEFIEQEVQRRIAKQTRQSNSEIESLRLALDKCKNVLATQNELLSKFTTEPFYYGVLLENNNRPDLSLFHVGDEVTVTNLSSPFYNQTGKITDLKQSGVIVVMFSNMATAEFDISVTGNVKLSNKSDGTYAVVLADGQPWEVKASFDPTLKPGDCVKIAYGAKQIVGKGEEFSVGPICKVVSVTQSGIEIEEKGERRRVINPKKLPILEGDRVSVDSTFFFITAKLPKICGDQYRLKTNLNVSWDDIGGLDEPKAQIREAIELPYQQPELFAHYSMKKSAGCLLFGPPGCGKTLLVKAAATSTARIHGKEPSEAGVTFIKSPELLNRYIGNTEEAIRVIFERERQFFRDNGYPSILAFDEFEAIAPQRGTRRSSDIDSTIVPMFLGEMDGVDSEQTRCNPIVFLMTNRPDSLDPAIIRHDRISMHIKVNRPDVDTSLDILKIHASKIPFQDGTNPEMILSIVVQDIFSKTKLIYRINNELDFTFGDMVNGAMLSAIVEQAKMNALRMDLKNGTTSGVNLDHFRQAVQQIYNQQNGLNHTYDLDDFGERHGIQVSKMNVDRCFINA